MPDGLTPSPSWKPNAILQGFGLEPRSLRSPGHFGVRIGCREPQGEAFNFPLVRWKKQSFYQDPPTGHQLRSVKVQQPSTNSLLEGAGMVLLPFRGLQPVCFAGDLKTGDVYAVPGNNSWQSW